MSWADAALIGAVLALAAMTGWCIALVIQRRRHVCPSATQPTAAFDPTGPVHRAVLMNAAGVVESVRTMSYGRPPSVLYRPHGKHRAPDRYHLIGQDGERALYRAES